MVVVEELVEVVGVMLVVEGVVKVEVMMVWRCGGCGRRGGGGVEVVVVVLEVEGMVKVEVMEVWRWWWW